MTRSILRTVLTTLALGLLFAGSFNLKNISAQTEIDEDAGSKCQELAGCPGGARLCGTILLPDSTTVRCGMRR